MDDEIKGYRAATQFEYNSDYVAKYFTEEDLFFAVSLNIPVSFETYRFKSWAPFLLDLIPQGAGRRFWEKKLNVMNNSSSDWKILTNGASNCGGMLRIKSAVTPLQQIKFSGFKKKLIWEQKSKVLTEIEKLGIPIGSSSSVQGDAPKFYLTEDLKGNWFPGGILSTEKIKKEWIVKFPRSSKPKDLLVLKMEERYYKIATDFGIKTNEKLQWFKDTLFIPRFDVKIKNKKQYRHGLESLASALEIAEFGANPNHEKFLDAIFKFSTNRNKDLKEYVLRDILNFCMCNTDNHPRNTAFLKIKNKCGLSPLYDFAPMILDTEGITRVCRWQSPREIAGVPNWNLIQDYLEIWSQKNNLKINWNAFFKNSERKIVILKLNIHNYKLDKQLTQNCLENINLALGSFK